MLTIYCYCQCFCLILLLLVIGNNAKLDIREIEGSLYTDFNLQFNNAIEYVLVFPATDSIYPYRIIASSPDASIFYPVLIVVRQERQVLSWEIPFTVETTSKEDKLTFRNTSRTLCHDSMDIITSKTRNSLFQSVKSKGFQQEFIVAVSTSSQKTVSVSIRVIEETEFYIKTDVQYSLIASPSETRYVYYKFPDNRSDTVLVKIDSDDDVCLTVSVQDSLCPVFDLDKDIKHEGKFQTINRKGGLSILRREFPLGFFLVFVPKGDNHDCSQEGSMLPIPGWDRAIVFHNRTSKVTFVVEKGINGGDYGKAVWITLAAIAGFYVIALLLVYLFTRCGSLSKLRKLSTVDVLAPDLPCPPNKEQIDRLLRMKQVPVKMLAQYPETDKRRSFNYLWHILSIAIFYSIPVVQLVITYQRIVNFSGNQDMCYYNFLCAHPVAGLSDFNHIYSNIGYVFIGILFLIVSLHRHSLLKDRPGRGIPVHYGLYYAMGIALIIEGLLSACYHICPSQSNYQFDTSFMYVMAVLCMVKLYQNRHPDINATAYATFSVLGTAIFLAMVGILDGTLTVWIVFAVIYSLLSIYVSFKIYFLSYIFVGLRNFKKEVIDESPTKTAFKPIRKTRFFVLLVVNLINYAILITVLCLYDRGITDFGTFLLGLLMANAVLHTVFYTCMKLINGERICIEAILYGVLMIVCWGVSAYFFLDNATLWTVTPAESRQRNQDCILLGFYDTHDVWHLLSAPGLYFTFMFLLSLDDDLIDTPQEEIRVF